MALRKAFIATGKPDGAAPAIAAAVERSVIPTAAAEPIDIETIQDAVQNELLLRGEESTATAYAAYRRRREEERKNAQTPDAQQAVRIVHRKSGDLCFWSDELWCEWLRDPLAESAISMEIGELLSVMLRGAPDELSEDELRSIVLSNVLRLSSEDPRFIVLGTAIARQFLWNEVIATPDDGRAMELRFGDHIAKAVEAGLLDERFRDFDCVSLAKKLDYGRDRLLDWNAFDLLYRKFLLRGGDGPLELIQWFWLRVAVGLHLNGPAASSEKQILELYGALSRLEFCPAETALLYGGTARPNLLSDYVYALEDNMEDIMVRGIAENALASRWGAGLGGSWSLVRGNGAPIGGSRKISSGVIPFLDLHRHQLAIAGSESGGCAYLAIWHADADEFIELQKKFKSTTKAAGGGLRTCLCIVDLFMDRLADGGEWWTFFQPNDVPELATLSGAEFAARYCQCEAMAERGELWSKRVKVKELWQKILANAFESGFPCLAFCDNFQKQAATASLPITAASVFGDCAMAMDGGETACCACGTISLPAHLNADGSFSWERLNDTVSVAVRAMDNVLSLTHFPSSGAEQHCRRLRGLALSVAGLHDVLRIRSIPYDSDGAERLSAEIFERLGHGAVSASTQLAVERGPIAENPYLTGPFPGEIDELQVAADLNWDTLHDFVRRNGLRNGYFLAGSAPISAATILTVSPGTLPLAANVRTLQLPSGERIYSIDPHLVCRLQREGLWNLDLAGALCHLDGDLMAFPELPQELRHVFATAFDCDQEKLIAMAAARQLRIDQSQVLPLHLRMPTFFHLSSLLQLAWKAGIKVLGPLITTHAISREWAMAAVLE